jgi:hypothetical protein
VIPVAWTPGTNGPISAPIVVAQLDKVEHFEKHRGKLAGKIVLVSHPGTGSEPTEPPFKRLTDEELRKADTYQQPNYSPATIEKTLQTADFAEKRDAFLKAEGALAWVRISYRDGGLVHGAGYSYQAGRTPALPGFEMAAEDYRRLARLALTDAKPTLELMSDVLPRRGHVRLQHPRRDPRHRSARGLCDGWCPPRFLDCRRRRGR